MSLWKLMPKTVVKTEEDTFSQLRTKYNIWLSYPAFHPRPYFIPPRSLTNTAELFRCPVSVNSSFVRRDVILPVTPRAHLVLPGGQGPFFPLPPQLLPAVQFDPAQLVGRDTRLV